ncbi:SDR family oxidoreductase [Williamsia sp.]|uniref:SDR family oxidoreductase n=1 Tax=Williamsia sp. TaxID=1872085 RepID=UPI002F927C4A
MTTYLITGATGRIGTPTTAQLRAQGHDVRALSRRTGPGLVAGDLLSGSGVEGAMAGVDTVIHLATTNGAKDIQIAENLFSAAASAHVRHVVLLSIVGIDKIPMGFYKQRLAIESIATESGVPLTLQRSTQFHTFVDTLFSAQRFLPVLIAPSIRFQPIATQEVAARLVTLAAGESSGRVDDIGGPQQRTAADLLAAWKDARGSRRPGMPLRLPGKAFNAVAAGNNLAAGTPFGHETFDQYLAQKYQSGR